WKFKKISAKKIKNAHRPLHVTLLPNPDIIADVSRRLRASANGNGRHTIVVGFALETDHRMANAKKKLQRKALDLIVANGPDSLGLNHSRVALLDRRGVTRRLPLMTKAKTAREILRGIE